MISHDAKPSLTTPTVHLNGSGRQSLLSHYMIARVKLREARAALVDCEPNGRDYYPQGDVAFNHARAEHLARLAGLDAVDAELAALAQAVADAPGRL